MSPFQRKIPSATRLPVPGPLLWLLLLSTPPLAAQDATGDGWNSPRTLDLVQRGREARGQLAGPGELRTYRAETRGNVYFYVDPEGEGERTLLRADQVAVDLYWMSPNLTRQIIVGHREEKLLPIRDFHYFLDRLTLVQYGLGDRIRVGEGMDVEDVPHPLAPVSVAEAAYDYRLADSVTVTLPGEPEPIRVYEIEVRPREPGKPAVVGSVHLDRASGALVRMDFTFTPSSYVDPRNDRVRISVEYGLWEGRYWLPHEQTVEVRRELPQVDLGIGTIILAVLRTGNYELNVPLELDFFMAPRVSRVSREELEAFPFADDPLERFRELDRGRIVQEVDARELHRRARRILGRTYATGLPSIRFHLPGASSALRFNRAEGWRAGGGVALRPHSLLDVRLTGGYAAGPGEPSIRGDAELHLVPAVSLQLQAYRRDVVDIGPHAGADGLLNSLSALAAGVDYMDLYARDGAQIGVRRPWAGGWEAGAGIRFERHLGLGLHHTGSPLGGSGAFRSVREVEETNLGAGWLRAAGRTPEELPGAGRWEVNVEGGRWEDQGFLQVRLSARTVLGEARPGSGLELGLRGGATAGPLPLQRHFLLGGRHTIPGHPYRSFAGRHYGQASVTSATDLAHPWIRARFGLWGGWTGGLSPEVAERWQVARTDGLRVGATIGAGFLYDLLRADVARGGPSGEWQLLLSIDPAWWDRL